MVSETEHGPVRSQSQRNFMTYHTPGVALNARVLIISERLAVYCTELALVVGALIE